MKLISTRTHATLDYTISILLVAVPWIFGFHDGTLAQLAAMANGAIILLVAVRTNYEGGFLRNISMRSHLTIDMIAGVMLAVSPWVMGFADMIYLPHLIVGVFEFIIPIVTDRTPYQLGRYMSARTAHRT